MSRALQIIIYTSTSIYLSINSNLFYSKNKFYLFAIQKQEDILRASCVGCGICSTVCPRGVLRLENL